MVTAGRAARFARGLFGLLRRDWNAVRRAVRGPFPVRPRLLSYTVHPPGGTRRIHLRIEADGCGVLLVDVTDAIHLNPTAALLARLALEGTPPERAAAALRRRFRRVDYARLPREIERIYALVDRLTTGADACPTCALRKRPLFSTPVHAPYKADLALTYGCNNACGHCYNPRRRKAMASLDTDQWRRVLEKVSAAGIPHVIFTGGEPTMVDDLPELIRAAGRLGLVTGLNTNGRRLAQEAFADTLRQAGLSHVQITLHSHRAEVHNAVTAARSFDETVRGIRNALAAGLHTITNTTLTRRNVDHLEQIVEFLHALGLRTLAINGMIYSGGGRTSDDALTAEAMAPALVAAADRAAELAVRLLWYTPTPYCRLSPVELELGPRRCNAGEYSICIEPNGDVLPCQSYYAPVGNILRDRWPQIWHSPLLRCFRDRVADPAACGLPPRCWECPDLPLCGGGCRLEWEHEPLANEPTLVPMVRMGT